MAMRSSALARSEAGVLPLRSESRSEPTAATMDSTIDGSCNPPISRGANKLTLSTEHRT